MAWIKKIVYAVHQFIDVVIDDTGEIIDGQSETEYYDSYSDAEKRFYELRQLIGEEICYWGDGDVVGILTDVDFDEDPRGIEFF